MMDGYMEIKKMNGNEKNLSWNLLKSYTVDFMYDIVISFKWTRKTNQDGFDFNVFFSSLITVYFVNGLMR